MDTGSKENLIAAVDVGTSWVKGALYGTRGERGTVGVTAAAELAPVRLAGVRAEQDPANLREAVERVLLQLAAQAAPGTWAGLALTTQRGTLMPVDLDGQPVGAMLSWLDRRSGAAPGSGRWQWLQEHEPERVERTAHLWSLMSWLTWQLTGEAVDTAQTSPPETSAWRLAGPAATALSPRVSREVAPGQVLAIGAGANGRWARELGLPSGLPFIIAGGDKNCELVGAGAVEPGRGVVSWGTAVSLGTLLPAASRPPGVYLTPANVPGLVQAEVGLPYGGGVWSWLGGVLGEGVQALEIGSLTAETPLFRPYLAGSLADAAATGAWTGLTAKTSAHDLAASGLEGVLFDLKRGRAALPVVFDEVTLLGGGSQNPVLPAWLANALGCRVRSLPSLSSGTAGAAVTAGVALGLAPGWHEASRRWGLEPGVAVAPSGAQAALWEERFGRWLTFAGQGGV